MTVAVGTVLAGRYEILDRIADGGMSTVYRARRQPDGLIVAVKVLRPQYAADREFIERFSREARAAEALRHPNIVQVFESGRDGDVHFIAMEYVEGSDLKGHVRRVGRLDPADAERIAMAVCEALDYAHRQGIIHRDVKPQNILLAPDGTVKVADFGIARAMAAVTITQPGTVLGTVHYLSPEQARGAPVGRASDLYALGVVLYEMLTGRLPFEGDTPVAIALKHLHERPPRPRLVEPSVPLRLEGIVLTALAKRSEDRYRSARDMATDLAGETEFWKDAPDAMEATRQFELPAPPSPRRRRRLGAVHVAGIVVATLAVGIYLGVQALDRYLTVPEVEMPMLVGRPLPEAEQMARDARLVLDVTDRINSATVPANVVISQDQPPGKRLKQGRRVGVVVSLGVETVTVPDLAGRTVQEAQLALDDARLRVGALQDTYDDLARPGTVLRQDPAAGATVPADSPVTLVISRGPALVEMPSLVGRTLEEARRLLDEKGLMVAHLRTVGTVEIPPGVVIDQAPSAGTKLRPAEGTITLTVSARPGEEAAPPRAPVITAEPQPVQSPVATPTAAPPPTPVLQPTLPPRVTPTPARTPAATPAPPATSGQVRRTRIQVVVPEGGQQEVKIVVIDETGVHTVYRARHVPGDRVDQIVQSQGYTIIQVYVDNRLVQEVRP
ncbi:MAG: PASTA domain-containing protein [Armatimonadota bacterium]|nr:PASTA domain-containing protein [Armatimonadota bacterium]